MRFNPIRGWRGNIRIPWVFTHGYSHLIPSDYAEF